MACDTGLIEHGYRGGTHALFGTPPGMAKTGRSRVVLANVLVCCATVAAAAAAAQEKTDKAESIRIEAVSGRAFRAALRVLSSHLDCGITYEDPPYEHRDTMSELVPGGPCVPRDQRVSFAFRQSEGVRKIDLIRSLLDAYNRTDPGAHFEVAEAQKGEDIFNVRPAETRRETGEWGPHHSLLSARVSFTAENETYASIGQTVCAQVEKQLKGIRLGDSWPPTRHFGHERLQFSAENEPAYSALNRLAALYASKGWGRVTWVLTRGPRSKFAFLSFEAVDRERLMPVNVYVESARPLADASRILERLCHVPIGYEDPVYAWKDDLLTDKSATHVVPRGDILAFSLPGQLPSSAVLDICLAAHHKSASYGAFGVRHKDGVYHVVPTASRDEKGAWVPRPSVLENGILLSAKSAWPRELFVSLCEQVAAKANCPVVLREFPEVPPGKSMSGNFSDRTARDCLTLLGQGVSQLIGKPVSSHLLYEPSVKGYALHVYAIERAEPKEDPIRGPVK